MLTTNTRLAEYKTWGLAWDVGVPPPAIGTQASFAFFETWAATNSLMGFIFALAGHASRASAEAGKVLDELARNGVPLPWRKAGSRADPLKELTAHTQLLWELLLSRHVDNWLNYVASLLYEIFRARPGMLKTKDAKLDVATVLEQATIDDVVHLLAQRKVHELSYRPFAELCAFFEQQGLPIGREEDRAYISEAIEVRNIAVHNRCVVNEFFVRRVPLAGADAIGKKRWLNVRDVEPLAIVLAHVVREVDAAAVAHFGLSAREFEILPPRVEPLHNDST